MSRATTVYISMFILFGVGLWVVLAFGQSLAATPDVSGAWAVRPAGTELPYVGDWLEIEQSGKYARLRTAEGRSAGLKLTRHEGPGAGSNVTLTFEGDGVSLTIEGRPGTQRAHMRVIGPADLSFDAQRTVYQGKPLPKDPQPTAAPAATRPAVP